MSLPVILKFVYNHGNEEVIRRGKKIFYSSGVQLLDVDHLIEQARFRVRNDLYQNYYTVTINKFISTKDLSVRCQCPYNMGEICRHEVAALFQLNDIIQSGFFENTDVVYDQKHTMVRMRQVSKQVLQIFTAPDALDIADQWSAELRAKFKPGKTDKIEADIQDGDQNFHVMIQQNEERFFDTSCGCNESKFPLCIHKVTVILQLLKKHGPQYFQTLQNWDVQKNKLLSQYGYSLDDDLTGKFTFIYENGKPFLRVLDTSIQKVTVSNAPPVVKPEGKPIQAIQPEIIDNKHLVLILESKPKVFPFIVFHLAAAVPAEDKTHLLAPIEEIALNQFVNALRFREPERELLPIIRKFQDDELIKYLQKSMPFGDVAIDFEQLITNKPNQEVRHMIWEYFLPKYHKLFTKFNQYDFVFKKVKGKPLSAKNLEPIAISDRYAHPQLEVSKQGDHYEVLLQWIIDHSATDYEDVELLNAALVMHHHTVYAIGHLDEIKIVEQFLPDGKMIISAANWPNVLKNTLMPWSKELHVHFKEELIDYVEKVRPSCIVYLQEKDNVFVIKPVFAYHDIEISPDHFGNVIQPMDGVVKIVQRNEELERDYLDQLKTLHSDINYNKRDNYYYLSGSAVLSNNWFFRFTTHMREWGIEVRGFETLRNLRINTHRPETEVKVSSGIDWFDTTVNLKFGDQTVSIIEVKKALAQKQNYVRLGDGSLGLLPEDWLKKYTLLLKVGETRGNKIRLKKFHFSVLDELLTDIDEQALLEELEVKKMRLEQIMDNDYSAVRPPDYLEAVLRPYQLAGFQWLKFLNEAGWGGILADDMGLGKTVQTLAFFQHYKNIHPSPKYLVVCPTTLMFNWENEINKFTPTITKAIHHGPKRASTAALFENFDVIITTYGTMRSDIKMLREIEFDYVVLDESQSIKNPQSQVAKASLLLNCKNRLALSGTPLQNNTFDLYAQMNFLNPGMLGSREFFMSEFATPIDKFREDDVKGQLRKLTYPFLLRRTKEQVAKDLPEKTETILFCEMGTEQRKIYDAYKNTYRSQILGMIEERGMERSQMHILQGLTKLRQICDSPAIMNEEEKFPNHSIKLDELSREIMENVGDHKVLIFSQFLGMLALIKDKLKAEDIPFVYFDGSSSSAQREAAINTFQNDHDCRVFLISLKAGGIGLNLTAADYVYIVDPWWNPAVEQQAIDRTHRIGQTKNIFAYRLICKDTLEEKMLQLQEQKRALANELVSDDNAFMKRLTKDDIAFLFS